MYFPLGLIITFRPLLVPLAAYLLEGAAAAPLSHFLGVNVVGKDLAEEVQLLAGSPKALRHPNRRSVALYD